ncbi:MAG: molybdopterin cofactor-binding domain-containing protein, partial [Myxococcota bacterium]
MNLNRRLFLQGSAAASAGLMLGFNLSCSSDSTEPELPEVEFAPNAFVRIGTDNTVTIISKHIELGQGTFTGLATILADELDAAWEQVRVEHAPMDPQKYGNAALGEIPGIGPVMSTGGSTAMAASWMQMREAGAAARSMLVAAAAAEWDVSVSSISVEDGVVSASGSGQSATFGELARAAAAMPVPDSIELKSASDFKLIGSEVPRVDVASKTDGTAQYTIDVYQPEMLTAVVAHPPRFGGTVVSFDDSATRQVPG